MIAADGRKAAVSIGLTRPEFGALMRGFGASDGLRVRLGRIGDAGDRVNSATRVRAW